MDNTVDRRSSLRLSGTLLLVGQLLYILVTLFHADGEANDHPAVFAEYARSGNWTAVHLAQFFAMAILLAGVLALFSTLEVEGGAVRWASRFGSASTVAAVALYGALQAVDGVANRRADIAWMNAAGAEKAARFASAEAIRWIEWGMRSYQDFAVALALLLLAVAMVRTRWLPRSMGYLVGLAGLTYLAQGWIVGTSGFSQTESIVIVLAWILGVAWMVWLIVFAQRMQDSRLPNDSYIGGNVRVQSGR